MSFPQVQSVTETLSQSQDTMTTTIAVLPEIEGGGDAVKRIGIGLGVSL